VFIVKIAKNFQFHWTDLRSTAV